MVGTRSSRRKVLTTEQNAADTQSSPQFPTGSQDHNEQPCISAFDDPMALTSLDSTSMQLESLDINGTTTDSSSELKSLTKQPVAKDFSIEDSTALQERNSDNEAGIDDVEKQSTPIHQELESSHSASQTEDVCEDAEEVSSNEERSTHRDHFALLMKSGEVIAIDPFDTIPLTCVREISASGVAKLEMAFQRSPSGPGMSMGVSSAAPLPIVVKIPEGRLCIVVEYFMSKKGLSEQNAYAISGSKIWYGIVEGEHRRKALINLAEKNQELFKGYSWNVLRIGWQSLDILRAMARERNELQRDLHLVELTMYDVFKNLKLSADEVALQEGRTGGRVSNRGYLKHVGDHYCGGADTANLLTRHLAGISVALSWPVIETFGEILNKENPDTARNLELDPNEGSSEFRDARVYRNIITKSTLRGATTFKTVAAETEHTNTLRRLQFLAPQRNFKPFSKSELESQTKKAIAARREVEKMEKRLQGHEWPVDLVVLRETLLKKTLLDEKVELIESEEDLLPEFKTLRETLFPIAAELDIANKASHAQDDSQERSDEIEVSEENASEDAPGEMGDETPSEGENPALIENGTENISTGTMDCGDGRSEAEGGEEDSVGQYESLHSSYKLPFR